MTELRGFCRVLSARSCEDESAPYVRVWAAILENIINDEDSSRKEAVKLIDETMNDTDQHLSESNFNRLNSVRNYLWGKDEE